MDTVLREYFSNESEEFNNYTAKSHSLSRETSNWEHLYTDILDKEVKRILNVGCGPGTEAILLAKMGYEVTALDFSPQMIEYTKENAKLHNVSIKTVIGDAEDLPFEGDCFDAIVSNYAMWAIPNPQKAMEEWHRVLRPGGEVAYIDVGHSENKGLRKTWARLAMKLRKKDNNDHSRELSDEETSHLSNLWSTRMTRPGEDLKLMKDAGFYKVECIDKVDRRIFSGMRYVEYGYHKIHFMIRGWKPSE